MTEAHRARLFATYNETHVTHLDPGDSVKMGWFRNYARRHYLPRLTALNPSQARVLDIGCNKGYLLAVLAEHGFEHLVGVDLSPVDVEIAKGIAPTATIHCVDAFDYLAQQLDQFDAIVLKAVLEHLPKSETLPMLEAIRRALKPGGMVLVDVPNMDWFFATHERYMDFTHEAGFTPESLHQVLGNVFAQVAVFPVDSSPDDGWRLIKKRVARFLLSRLFLWADAEGGRLPIWSRSLVGIGSKP